jgi:hypothetical protein
MTDTDWWARVVQARTQVDDLRRRACGRCARWAREVHGKGAGVMKFDERMVRHTELVMVVAVMILVLIAYVISKLRAKEWGIQ